MWYVLAAANAVTDADLVAGTTLRAPQVTTSANDASTFKPYDPNAILGPTTPSLPYITPPPKQECNALATILIVVVAIIVTVYTAGAASFAMSGLTTAATGGQLVAAAAIGGAAGSAAGMAVGSAMGVSSFSWRGVAAGAITGALTAGIGSFGTVGEALKSGTAAGWTKAAGLALANAGANYAGQKLAGVDVSFSWASIAASAVSSVASAKLAPLAVQKLGLQSAFANDFAHGMAGGLVSAAVRSSFGQTLHGSDYLTIAADAFGNALANSTSRRNRSQPVEGVADARVATTVGLGTDENPVSTTPLGERAMGSSVAPEYITSASVPFDNSIRTLATLEVLGSRTGGSEYESRNQDYFNRWSYSALYGAPGPRRGMSTQDLSRLYRQQVSWRNHLPETKAYDQWVAKSWEGHSVGGGNVSIDPYTARYNAINDGLRKLAAPLVKGLEALDGLLAPVESELKNWSLFNKEMSANASGQARSAWGAAGNAAVGSFNASVGDILTGGVSLLRLGTNPGRLASLAGGVETLLSSRPSDTAARAIDAWNDMSQMEKLQTGLTAAMGFALSTSRVSRLSVVDRSISTAYGEMSAAERAAGSVTVRERVLANIAENKAALKSSEYLTFARRATAREFLSSSGFSAGKVDAILDGGGIDFTKPVAVRTFEAGTQVQQLVKAGRVGDWFGPLGQSPDASGVAAGMREPWAFAAGQRLQVLESRAAPVVDTWTLGKKYPVTTSGGGLQWIPSNKNLFIPIQGPY